MNSTPTILKVTGVLLLLSCVFCVPGVGKGADASTRLARSRMVEDFEKRMTPEELTRIFQIPMSERDRQGFMRRQLVPVIPAAQQHIPMLLLQSLFLGVGLLALGFYESWSRRDHAVQGPAPFTRIVCGTCGYDMMGLPQGMPCPECAGKSA